MIDLADLARPERLAVSLPLLAFAVGLGVWSSIDARFARVDGPARKAAFGATLLALIAAWIGPGYVPAVLLLGAASVALAAWAVARLPGARVRPRPDGVRLPVGSAAVQVAMGLNLIVRLDLTLPGLGLHLLAAVLLAWSAWHLAARWARRARQPAAQPSWDPGDVESLARRDVARARAMEAPVDDAVRAGPSRVRSVDEPR